MDSKEPKDYIKLRVVGKRKVIRAGLRAVTFQSGEHYIEFIPSLNLTSYGDTEEEAADMMAKVVLNDYVENLLELTESEIMKELKQYGWTRKPFLTKQLRNIQFLDVETIKQNFDLPAETVIREQYVTA